MEQPFLRLLFRPELNEPILVCGLPGVGNVGSVAASLLIESSDAKLFAELYSSSFHDYVLIDDEGVCHLPKYQFHVATVKRKDLIILTGDGHPSLEDVPAYYEISGNVLDLAVDYGCRLIVTMDSIPGPNMSNEVYVAGTSQETIAKLIEAGATIYRGSRIIGVPGLLLGLAKERRLKGIGLFGSTRGLTEDRESASTVNSFLMKNLDIL